MTYNSQIWTELTETQAEAINGGLIIGNIAIASKLTYQENGALVLASGNAIGIQNTAGVVVAQTNVA